MKYMKYMCVVIISYCFGSFSAKNPVSMPVLALDFFQFTFLGFAISSTFSFLRQCLCRMALPLVPVLQTPLGVVGAWEHHFGRLHSLTRQEEFIVSGMPAIA